MKKLECVSMIGPGCKDPVSKIDSRGFIYCKGCGSQRKGSGEKVLSLTKEELETLKSGNTIKARF